MILLTSFKNLPKGMPAYSISRWQPRGHNLNELKFLAPLDMFGRKLEGFKNHHEYRRLYKATLETRKEAIENWINGIDKKRNFALTCWCTIGQQKTKGYEHIMCHRVLIGLSIAKRRKDIKIVCDWDSYRYSIFEHDFDLFNLKRWRRNEAGRRSKSLY